MTFDISVQTKDLVKALTLASSIVEKKHSIQILGHFKLQTYDGHLYITATDSDIEITQKIGANVKEHGALTVSAQTFSEIVRKIPDGEISIKFVSSSSQLDISSACCNFKLPTLSADNFPVMDDIQSIASLVIPASAMSMLIEHTKFAMSTEETRYNLNGIYLHTTESNPNILHAAATDCHRLSLSSIELKSAIPQISAIIPAKTVQEMLRILKDSQIADKDINLAVSYNRLEFSCQNIVLKSKIIDGSFPEYQAFIPDTNEYKLVVQSKTLAEIIDRVSTIANNDKFRAIKIICNNTQIEVHAAGSVGTAQEVLSNHLYSTLSYSGPEIVIGFNPKYMLDALNAVPDCLITIELQNESSPVVLRPDKYPQAKFIVMPINV